MWRRDSSREHDLGFEEAASTKAELDQERSRVQTFASDLEAERKNVVPGMQAALKNVQDLAPNESEKRQAGVQGGGTGKSQNFHIFRKNNFSRNGQKRSQRVQNGVQRAQNAVLVALRSRKISKKQIILRKPCNFSISAYFTVRFHSSGNVHWC